MYPNFAIEESLGGKVIGVDEVGRGPLAGPVVAAAIILDDKAVKIGINDSKKLSKSQREKIYEILIKDYAYQVSFIDSATIDEINILNATKLAMKTVIEAFPSHHHAIVDGNVSPFPSSNITAITKGDQKSLTIAAASIIAKVQRDLYMSDLAQKFPYYGWERNSGYGTKEHIEAIKNNGLTEYHRRSFVRNIINKIGE
jgi:ribonuclease HII